MCSPAKGGSTTLGSVLLSPGLTQERGQPLNLERLVMFCCEFCYEFAKSPHSALRIQVLSPCSSPVYHLHVKFLAVNFAEVGTRLGFVKVGVSPHAVHFALLICGNNRGSKNASKQAMVQYKSTAGKPAFKKGALGLVGMRCD